MDPLKKLHVRILKKGEEEYEVNALSLDEEVWFLMPEDLKNLKQHTELVNNDIIINSSKSIKRLGGYRTTAIPFEHELQAQYLDDDGKFCINNQHLDTMSAVDKSIACFIVRTLISIGKPVKFSCLLSYNIGAKTVTNSKTFDCIPRTADGLKTFLLKYPELFYTFDDSLISPTDLAIDSYGSPYYKMLEKNTIDLIVRVLTERSLFSLFPIQHFRRHFIYHNTLILGNVKETSVLKNFLQRFPDIFTVKNEDVILTVSENTINSATKEHLYNKSDTNNEMSLNVKSSKNSDDVDAAVYFWEKLSNTSCSERIMAIDNVSQYMNQELYKSTKKCLYKKSETTLNVNRSKNSDVDAPIDFCEQLLKANTNRIMALDHVPQNKYQGKSDDSSSPFIKKSQTIPSTTDAATYFYEQLLKASTCRILTIDELYKLKSYAPKEIQSTSGSTYKEFKEFLLRYPDHFIVTNTNVLARRNKKRNRWVPPEVIIPPPIRNMLIKFFKDYITIDEQVCIHDIFSELGNQFSKNDGKFIFKNAKQIAKFLATFPDIFFVDGDYVINLLSKDQFKQAIYKVEDVTVTKNNYDVTIIPNNILFDLIDWKAEVLKRTIVIDDLDKCRNVCRNILKSEHVIAIDCEGLNLGADGKLRLLQICKMNGEVYIFDILGLPEMINEGIIQDILESVKIIKVIHDCHNDSANLFHEYDVRLKNIFDTRVAHSFIRKHDSTKPSRPIGFNQLCNIYKAPVNTEMGELKDIYKTNPDFWLERPLSEDMKACAALGVSCLVPYVYNAMMEKLEGMEQMVIDLSFKHSRSAF